MQFLFGDKSKSLFLRASTAESVKSSNDSLSVRNYKYTKCKCCEGLMTDPISWNGYMYEREHLKNMINENSG